MVISVTFSKPAPQCAQEFDRDYLRIKIKAAGNASGEMYLAEFFTKTQVFHEKLTAAALDLFIEKHGGKTFKNCVIRTEDEEITILANKRGKITRLSKKIIPQNSSNAGYAAVNTEKNNHGTAFSAVKNIIEDSCNMRSGFGNNRTKNYILQEGEPVPFLVLLGIMTADGKVIASKYAKFRQINRFLEFIDDILPRILTKIEITTSRPLRIADFGCGKSYLTFAVYHFLKNIKKINTEIIGLDLKKDVIEFCTKTANQLGYEGLHFDTGNIENYKYTARPDIVITLHACDTATDFALEYAVKNSCTAILSVPCCQHEINAQLDKNADRRKKINAGASAKVFDSLLKYGIIKERFAALLTDALRAQYLESKGYSVRLLEFIDMEHTPKNILIRAVKVNTDNEKLKEESLKSAAALTDALCLEPALKRLLKL
ncbi:MAG: class I SAM-dependent methyltransferase [Treponema sp.]